MDSIELVNSVSRGDGVGVEGGTGEEVPGISQFVRLGGSRTDCRG